MGVQIPFKPYLPFDGRRLRRKPLTCVIAAKGAYGCVVVANTSVMRDFQASNQSKFHILWNKVAITGAGTGLLLDELEEGLSELQIPSNANFRTIRTEVEDVMRRISHSYQDGLNDDFNVEAALTGLEGFDRGEPDLRIVRPQGVSERVEGMVVFGHGDRPTAPMFKEH